MLWAGFVSLAAIGAAAAQERVQSTLCNPNNNGTIYDYQELDLFETRNVPLSDYRGQQEPAANGTELANGIKYVRPGNLFEPNFRLFKKIEVNGENEHPLYKFLKLSPLSKFFYFIHYRIRLCVEVSSYLTSWAYKTDEQREWCAASPVDTPPPRPPPNTTTPRTSADGQHSILVVDTPSSCPPTRLDFMKPSMLIYEPLRSYDVRWNWEKFLITKSGMPYKRYDPSTPPLEIANDLRSCLPPRAWCHEGAALNPRVGGAGSGGSSVGSSSTFILTPVTSAGHADGWRRRQ
ncbi:Glutathione peroxidase 6 [Penaeus vannamei]|uniref:Glutathione peroxidase 6 n=1 Tax=Penaeus vannamei TaxID=6689 RepID=A0A3R7M078_PENVA|nr:Glutathione peroxidase 6 [Penaeus vannamei]